MEELHGLRVTESDIRSLTDGWRALSSAYDSDAGAADRWLGVLTSLYSEPHRRYHNLHHVAEVLRLLERFGDCAADRAALGFAAWFHDAVYDTRKNTNEEESVALAERALAELCVPASTVTRVRRLILVTKRHEAEGDLPDLGLFLDADLSILGSPEDSYLAYGAAIREEYSWVPEAVYREGRLKVLDNFLRRERLYYTTQIAELLDAPARRNLSDEIRRLST